MIKKITIQISFTNLILMYPCITNLNEISINAVDTLLKMLFCSIRAVEKPSYMLEKYYSSKFLVLNHIKITR